MEKVPPHKMSIKDVVERIGFEESFDYFKSNLENVSSEEVEQIFWLNLVLDYVSTRISQNGNGHHEEHLAEGIPIEDAVGPEVAANLVGILELISDTEASQNGSQSNGHQNGNISKGKPGEIKAQNVKNPPKEKPNKRRSLPKKNKSEKDLEEPSAEDLRQIEMENQDEAWINPGDLLSNAKYLWSADNKDSVGMYFLEAMQTPLLTAAEEVDLAKQIEKGLEAQNMDIDDNKLADLVTYEYQLDSYIKALEIKLKVEDANFIDSEETQKIISGGEESWNLLPEWMQQEIASKPEFQERIHTAEELKKYADPVKLIQEGLMARDLMIKANTRLVISIAKKYLGNGLPFPDLIQEGNLGLIRAVDKFQYERGYKFSTYATWWIRQKVTRAILDQGRTIRNPVHIGEKIKQLYKVEYELAQELGRWPSIEEIAEKTGYTPKKVTELFNASRRTKSLEDTVGDDGDTEFGEFVEDLKAENPVKLANHALLSEALGEFLLELPPRYAKILRLRFGLQNGQSYTLEKIAYKFGVSRERIRQIEKHALKILKNNPKTKNLKDFLESD